MGHGHLDFNLFPNRFQESIFHPLTRLQIPALYWIISKRRSELPAQLLLREKSGA
jgi:hypothetical protein